jgi:predicted HTH domain antitoxin
MPTLIVEYPANLPDSARQTRGEFERTMRFALASKLFELGKLSSGQAASLIPMDRYQFLKSILQVGVAAIQWSPDEVDSEIANA